MIREKGEVDPIATKGSSEACEASRVWNLSRREALIVTGVKRVGRVQVRNDSCNSQGPKGS